MGQAQHFKPKRCAQPRVRTFANQATCSNWASLETRVSFHRIEDQTPGTANDRHPTALHQIHIGEPSSPPFSPTNPLPTTVLKVKDWIGTLPPEKTPYKRNSASPDHFYAMRLQRMHRHHHHLFHRRASIDQNRDLLLETRSTHFHQNPKAGHLT
ncbi:Uncharacterized protein Rs2_05263 [Raphanus sativus]|nr:Uncharacterized protein Rs2_05263 [Raphanus sativus]